jgi:adenylate cyclase
MASVSPEDPRRDEGGAASSRGLRELLLLLGADDEEIERARHDDMLDLLVADRLLLPSWARYDEGEVSRITGLPVELSRRFWRALGFPDPRPDDKMFTDLDIEAIRNLESIVELGLVDVETLLQLARVVGSSMARIADSQLPAVIVGALPSADSEDTVDAAERFARVAEEMLPATTRLLEFAWRRHIQAAVRRAMTLRLRGESANLPNLCVGFADMVGFTMISQQLSEEELGLLVGRFEDVAHDVVTSLGGRVVKMIGDEVMFVSESVTAAADIAIGLAEAYADDELLSDVRVALAVGPVLVQDGDYYGPVVNLANRVVDIAAPGCVLVTDDFRSALLGEHGDEAHGYQFSQVPTRNVKDCGRVSLWSLSRLGADLHQVEARLGRRWERLSDVLRELEELRERGEKLISSGLRAAMQSDTQPEESGDRHRRQEPGS